MQPAFRPVGGQEEGSYPNLPSYAPGGLVRLAPDGRILHATPALAEMLGHEDVGALTGGNLVQLCINPDDGRQLLLRLACENLVRGFELEFRRVDGVGILVRVDGRAFRDRNGQPRYSEALIQDVTASSRPEREQPAPETERSCTSNRDHRGTRKPSVVIIEPDSEIRLHLKALRNGRYEVLVAVNESDARNLLAAHVGEVEIILVDISLNGADSGLRLTKALREEGAWTDVPIIATMACALAENEKKALAAGCNGYLVKPSRRKDAFARVEDGPFRPCPIPSGRWGGWRRFSRRLIRHALRVTT